MKKHQLIKQSQTGNILMTIANLKICVQNQEGYETLYLNDSLQLQYCNFVNIANLQQCINTQQTAESQQLTNQQHSSISTRGINTLFLNNNQISKIQNLHPLALTLVTLNLSHNQISKFQGMKQLVNLVVLDLSFNLVREIKADEIKQLKKLNRLNLAANLFETGESIKAIEELKDNLQTFDLSSNQSFNPQPQILTELFAHMHCLKALFLKQTPFVRMTSAYRKRMILLIKSLTFLDERPVTEDERLLAQAWQKGGLKQENEARKLIKEKSELKNKKNYEQIEERQKIINQKVEKIFKQKAKAYITQLQNLKSSTLTQDFQLLTSQQESLVRLKIQQLQRYLQLLKEQYRCLDLDRELGINTDDLPKMLVQKRTSECIFVYNVEQTQLQAIKQKYYSDEKLPLKVINYAKTMKQLEWLEEYNEILQRTYKLCKGNWEMIVPAFNLDVYDFDQSIGRKVKRFNEQELRMKFQEINKREVGNKEDQGENQVNLGSVTRELNELDCLD